MASANPRLRNFCFTLNNWTESEQLEALKFLDEKSTYYVIGREIGDSGTPHLQGYAELEKQTAFNTVKKALFRAHIEIRKGTAKEASDYCKKDGNFIEKGEISRPGTRSDLSTIKETITESKETTVRGLLPLVRNTQDLKFAENLMKYYEPKRDWMPEVCWYYGSTGTGKSRQAFDDCPDAYVSTGTGQWWDGYDGHENVIIDDFRADFMKYHDLLRLLDRYEYRVAIKGGFRQFRAKRIIITSPYSPKDVYPTQEDKKQLLRRISKIKNFDTGEECSGLDFFL